MLKIGQFSMPSKRAIVRQQNSDIDFVLKQKKRRVAKNESKNIKT